MYDCRSVAECDADCEPLSEPEPQALSDGVELGDSVPEAVRHAVGENDSVAVAVEHMDCVEDTDIEAVCDLEREPLGVKLLQALVLGDRLEDSVAELVVHRVGDTLGERVVELVLHGDGDPLVVEVIEDE